MRKLLAITDLTRMQEGRVCVAGCDREGNCIRPILPPPGIQESSLYSQGAPIVFPSALVEYDLIRPRPQAPHVEDWEYVRDSVRNVGQLDDQRRHAVLASSLHDRVHNVFDATILHGPGHYVISGTGTRSMGTVKPTRVLWIGHAQDADEKWKYRLRFRDGSDGIWELTVTDLTWRYYLDYQRVTLGYSPARIGAEMRRLLNDRECYLRLGLARGWAEFPDRCYIQITGVHSFPDYAEGRTFADFAPGQT